MNDAEKELAQIENAERLAKLQEEVMAEIGKTLRRCNKKVKPEDRMMVYTSSLSFILVEQYPAEHQENLSFLLRQIKRAYEFVWREISDTPIKNSFNIH